MSAFSLSKILSRLRLRDLSRELSEITKLPRRTRGQTSSIRLFGHPIHFADGASFEEQYWQIFHRRIYDITTATTRPKMIDGGANIGLASLRFLEQHPTGHVHAFEPDPALFSILEANTFHLSPEQITLHNSALWTHNGTISFASEGSDSGSVVHNQEFSTIEVTCEKLSEYLNGPVDFLKLDIEGAEITVLAEAEGRLQNVANLFVEHHSFERRPQDLSRLLELLERNGFRYKIDSPEIKHPFFFQAKSYLGMDAFSNIYAYRR